MPKPLQKLLCTIIASVVAVGPAAAGPLEDATAAYERNDDATAVRIIQPLADQGDVKAQRLLGLVYTWGLKNYPEAVKWLRKAADQADGEAQVELAYRYFHGGGRAAELC